MYRHKSQKRLVYVAFCLGFIYRFVMGLQCFDNVDMGYNMTFYQHIFTHPDALPFHYNFYLTGLFGGMWQYAFGDYGLVGFRTFDLIVETVGVYFIYRSVSPWINSHKIASVAVLASFLFPTTHITFYYNTLTFFILSVYVYSFSKWIRNQSAFFLFLSGMMIGLSFFVRSVNITLSVLLVLPFFLTRRISLENGQKNGLIIFSGMFVGICLIVSIMLYLGHLQYFIDGISIAFGILGDSDATHASSNLLWVFLKSFLNVLLHIVATCILATIYISSQRLSSYLRIGVKFLVVVVFAIIVLTNRPYTMALALNTVLLVGVCVNSLCGWLFSFRPSVKFKLIASVVLMLAYIVPLGSDTGIEHVYSRIGGLLVTIPAFLSLKRLKQKSLKRLAMLLFLFVCAGLVLRMLKIGTRNIFTRLNYTSIISPRTLNVAIEDTLATSYRNMVDKIGKYSGDNPLMLLGNQMSELYYATGKIPFTGNTMLDAYEGNNLKKQLDARLIHYKELPVIVFATLKADTEQTYKFRNEIRPWMDRHCYKSVYKDSDLEIFISSEYENGNLSSISCI